MSVFRIEKSKNYTVMSNHHLRNKDLSLKAKGLLSQMLSLPDDWDYTLKGLARINKEKIDAIRTAVLELEEAGYITRKQGRDALGKMAAIEYTIYEQPQPRLENPITEQPILENPCLENPISDKPTTENPTQLNIDKTNKEKLNTDVIKYPSINQREQPQKTDWIDRYDKNTERIKNNIEYKKSSTKGTTDPNDLYEEDDEDYETEDENTEVETDSEPEYEVEDENSEISDDESEDLEE